MKAIILAAGVGKRLYPVTKTIPKCLLELGGKTLIERSLDALNENGIIDVVIVVGYLKEQIIDKLGNNYRDTKIRYVENTSYDKTGSMHSLLLAKDEIVDDFIHMDADLLFHPDILINLLGSDNENAILYGPLSGDSGEEVKVYVDNGFATNIGKYVKTKDKCIGEAVGIVKYSKKAIPALMAEMEGLFLENHRSEHEDLTQRMCNKRIMRAISTGDLPWLEIDFPEDVDIAKNEVLTEINRCR